MKHRPFLTVALAVSLALVACGDDDDSATTDRAGASGTSSAAPDGSSATPSTSITLVTYDSWSDALDDVIAEFTAATGIGVDMLRAGDTGTMVSKAVLTAGNPEGDVMFGVDNTFLSRVVDEGVFEPYEAAGLDAVPGRAARADTGRRGHADRLRRRVRQLRQGVVRRAGPRAAGRPRGAGGPGVRGPARRREPGVVVAGPGVRAGDDRRVRRGRLDRLLDAACGPTASQVVDSWEDAYYGAFSGAGDGDRPLVVSYGSSPPAEVVFADPPIDAATTGVVDTTCFRQIEYAGVLRGTEHAAEAGQLIDFLLSERFQAELPLNLFVYPANADVALPEVFTANATVPTTPKSRRPGRPSPPTARRGWRRGPTPSCAEPARRAAARLVAALTALPAAFLVVFYAWPFATLLARGPVARGDRRRARAGVDVGGRLVHALAGGRQHGADGRPRARAGVRDGPLLVRRPAACSARCWRRRSCCRRSSWAPPCWRCCPPAWERGVPAILLAHVVFNLAVVVRTVGAVWDHLPPDLEAAAATLGASPWRAFREVTLPLLRPAVLAAASIVFVFTFTSFGVIRVLGDAGTSTIEVEVWRQATSFGDIGAAATLAVLQLLAIAAGADVVDVAAAPPQPGPRAAAAAPAGAGRAGRRQRDARRGRGRGHGTARRRAAARARRAVAARQRRALARRRGGRSASSEIRPGVSTGVAPLASVFTSLRTTAVATVDRRGHRRRRRARHRRGPARRAAARHRADAADRHVGGDDRLRRRSSRSTPRPSTGGRRGGSCPSGRRSSPSRSSCAPCCRCCAASTRTCTRPRPTLGASPTRAWREVTLAAPAPTGRRRHRARRGDLARRVRGDELPVAQRHADDADRHRRPARPRRRAAPGPGLRAGDDPRRGDRARRRRRSTSPATGDHDGRDREDLVLDVA